jgi:hypothetical protein
MRRWKKYLRFFGVVACGVWIGCAPKHAITVAGEKGVSAEAELDIQELVIRSVTKGGAAGEVLFVSFGESWNDNVDPPDAFLNRLADVDAVFKPVSEYKENPVTNPLLLIVRVTGWINETEAKVSVTRYRLGAGGADGFTAIVKWSQGVWRMGKSSALWTT